MFCLVAKNDSGPQAAVTHDALFDQWMQCKCDILFYVQPDASQNCLPVGLLYIRSHRTVPPSNKFVVYRASLFTVEDSFRNECEIWSWTARFFTALEIQWCCSCRGRRAIPCSSIRARDVFARVLEKMSTSEFQEIDSNEISLPGKSSTEVRELLLMIYPSTSEKQITDENCYFLVKLAHEYQVDAIVQKCEDVLVESLKTKPKDGTLSVLIFAQTYELEKLRQASVNQAHNLKLEELKSNEMYDQIQPENLREIMGGIITRLQRELAKSQRTSEKRKKKIDAVIRSNEDVKEWALQDVNAIAEFLAEHVQSKHNFAYIGSLDTDNYISALRKDVRDQRCKCGAQKCSSLSYTADYLTELKTRLESLRIS